MRITKISPCRTDKSRVMIYLDDRSWHKVSARTVHELGLKAGDEVCEETMPVINSAARKSRARETAARILGRRNMSSSELMRKLEEKGIAEQDAQAACEWAQEMGVVDDSAYAEMLVRHYRAKGFGNRRVAEELKKRGIGRGIIDTLLEEAPDMGAEIRAFIEKKTAGREITPALIGRVTAALERRGHGYGKIRAVFRELEIDMEDSD